MPKGNFKRKREFSSGLPWKKVDNKFDEADGEGWMGLEEVEGVDVVYESGPLGEKIVKLQQTDVSSNKPVENVVEDKQLNEEDENEDEEPKKKKSKKSEKRNQKKSQQKELQVVDNKNAESSQSKKPKSQVKEPLFDPKDLPEWSRHSLNLEEEIPSAILKILHDKSFKNPTPIQKESLSIVNNGKDIIGIAETGSGKTLAYALPVISAIIQGKISKDRLGALILCPTRELALQVSNEIQKISPIVDEISNKVNVATLVGGMSVQKQQRMLNRGSGANIIVATPGRLWDVLMDDGKLATKVIKTKYLVIDEADRMIEAGHFEEMDKILRMTQRHASSSTAEFQDEFSSTDLGLPEQVPPCNDMQTMVFSATLSKELQTNLKKRRKAGSGSKKNQEQRSSLDDLLMRLDFRDLEPAIVDLSPKSKVVSTLQESRLDILLTDKDLYLYYFLLRYPGKTLVFVSSIDTIRRMMPLFEILKQSVFPLHSGLQQRQRLKNFDKFKSLKSAVMIATDVAARGLDVPEVDHVIHYQVPRTADAYIHRSGRTARAQRSGLSVLFVSPEERRMANDLMKQLDKQDGIATLQIQYTLFDQLKHRMNLAKKIEQANHKINKSKHDSSWEKEAAEALGVDLESDHEETQYNSRGQKKKKVMSGKLSSREEMALESQKAELKTLLSQPLISRGVSGKYLTMNDSQLAHQLAHDNHHKNMLGVDNVKATNELKNIKKNNKRN